MKRYIVFLKQVPLSTKVEIDPIRKTLKRSSALCQTNPDDLYALQTAVNLKKKTGAEIIAVSMGPSSAKNVLREAIQRGADKAILISSQAFAGSDTWCTSFILSAVVRKIGNYDMLFFGRMAIDGDTAQVGPEVAGQLDIPQITQLESIESLNDETVTITKKAGNIRQKLQVTLPCALMVSKECTVLEYPTLEGWRKGQTQEIICWNEKDLELNSNEVGLYASPTKVVATNVPQNKKNIQWLQDNNAFCQIVHTCIYPQNK